ncbi:MAG: DHA2 family efflux MFS transporter permease subunit [Caulobacteraceae bacterium]|nr:DHA2 family efflux MFS transporter permease subunit [Caulobacteraceae bacterium]
MAAAQDIANRLPITGALMLATVMTSLDTTIANVALPHMQGSFSASQDQMIWVLTSYIVAATVATPLSGWLSSHFGRKAIFLASIAGFTIASMLCGIANSLAEAVIFRLLQGACGATMAPLSQATMLDLYPPRQFGPVMAVWSAGIWLGPIFGPLIGGWLTDNFSWRWVFYINLPVGVLAYAGVVAFMARDRAEKARPFDFLGFGALGIFISALQLALDRGPMLDWFDSPEIWAEAAFAAAGLYVFLVRTLTAQHPFFDRALVLDRNFVAGNLFGVVLSIVLFSTMALQPPLMQGLMGYTVFGAGLTMMPRGVGSFLSVLVVGRLIGRVDTRLLLAGGLALSAVATLQMSHFSLLMTTTPFVVSGIVQGVGMGLMMVPTTTLALATVSPRLRGEATSVYSLVRGLGRSVGISGMEAIFTHQAAVAHADMAADVQPSSPVFAAGLAGAGHPMTAGGLEVLNREITRQAAMVGYVDVFRLMCLGALSMIPLVLLMRPPRAMTTPVEDLD